jgi:hypothetical protein
MTEVLSDPGGANEITEELLDIAYATHNLRSNAAGARAVARLVEPYVGDGAEPLTFEQETKLANAVFVSYPI